MSEIVPLKKAFFIKPFLATRHLKRLRRTGFSVHPYVTKSMILSPTKLTLRGTLAKLPPIVSSENALDLSMNFKHEILGLAA